jgi:hypothetical protein
MIGRQLHMNNEDNEHISKVAQRPRNFPCLRDSMRDDENRAGDRFVVVIVALVILAALVLAGLLLLSTNEGLVRCRDTVGT